MQGKLAFPSLSKTYAFKIISMIERKRSGVES